MANIRYNNPFFNKGDWLDTANDMDKQNTQIVLFCVFLVLFIAGLLYFIVHREHRKLQEYFWSSIAGHIFGYGLVISGITRRSMVLNFLTFFKDYNVSFIFVMLVAIVLNIIIFYMVIHRRGGGIITGHLYLPSHNSTITPSLIVGSIVFGCGWGISGLCPGSALIGAVIYIPHILLYLLFVLIGQWLGVYVEFLTLRRLVSDAYNAIDS